MLSKLMQSFKLKKVKVKFETPSTFKWGQPELPVTLTLSNRSAEPRTITSVLFELREKKEGDSDLHEQDWSSGNIIRYEHSEQKTLEAGEDYRFDVLIPTSIDSFADLAGELPDWMKLAGKAIDGIQKLQPKSSWIEARASIYLHDFKTPIQKTRTIGSGLRIGR